MTRIEHFTSIALQELLRIGHKNNLNIEKSEIAKHCVELAVEIDKQITSAERARQSPNYYTETFKSS